MQLLDLQKGNETPRPEPVENVETRNQAGQVSEELTRVTRYRAPDPIVDDPVEAVKPYTSVKCSKEAKEVGAIVLDVLFFFSYGHRFKENLGLT